MKFFVTFAGGGSEAGYGTGSRDASRGALADQLAPVLSALGEVILLDGPEDAVSRAARSRVPAVHLCFALPHELPEAAGEETWAVFGLCLADCPTRPFAGRAGTDWRGRLARCGGVVCFSSHLARAVRTLMGEDYPVLVAPPPVACAGQPPAPAPAVLQVDGAVLDTRCWPDTAPADLPPPPAEDEDAPWPDPVALEEPPAAPWTKTARYRLGVTRLHFAYVYREAFRDLLPAPVARAVSLGGRVGTRAARRLLAQRQRPASPVAPPDAADPPPVEDPEAWQLGRVTVSLSGLVFAADHGAWDRGWKDALSAFVEICRADPDATLVVRTDELDEVTRAGFAGYLRRLGPFACRVLLIAGDIEGGLDALIAATHLYLCASPGEAAPLPMLRFMAAGRPAVSPAHSALADFVTPETAFVAEAGRDYEAFPGDLEERLDATGWRLDWESLCRGVAAGRALARTPDAYAARSATVRHSLRAFCGPDAVLATLSARWAERPPASGLAA